MRLIGQFVVSLVLAVTVTAAFGADYKPYPGPRVTTEQWQQYYDTVRAEYGASAQQFPDLRLVVFQDPAGASFAFTLPGHAAHPAWIARRIVQQDGRLFLDQAGYFAGEEAPFAALFEQYQQVNKRMMEEMNRMSAPK